MIAQRRDHLRLGRQLRRLQRAVAMAEALARLGYAAEVANIKLLAHARQQLVCKVQQAGLLLRLRPVPGV
jgi:uncharacterized protein YllA (UPF0747 family)